MPPLEEPSSRYKYPAAKELIEKMVENQGWEGDHFNPVHAVYIMSMEST
jgi:hypothetical protein